MNKQKLTNIINGIRSSVSKRSPEILTGVGIAGMIVTTVLAVKATPKALELIRHDSRINHDGDPYAYTKLEAIKSSWKCYIPAAATGISSIGCLIGASTVSARRNAALAAAYTLSDTALRDYQGKVMEAIGEKQERVIHDKISEEKVKENPVGDREIIISDKAETLFFEPLSSRYFKSDINTVKKAQNDLNERILTDPFNSGVSLNDFYREIGLSASSIGENMGWNLESGKIDIYMSAQMINDGSQYDGTPCVVLNYRTPPKYDF